MRTEERATSLSVTASENRLLHIAQTHRAHITLNLRQDMRRLQLLEYVIEDFVDRKTRVRRSLHLQVNAAAVRVHVDQRACAGGKMVDLRRIVALMRTPDE